jgi:hypothetical protein
MSLTLRASDIDDMVIGTLDDLGSPDFEMVAQDLQEYPVMSNWLKSDKVTEQGGLGISRRLMDRTNGAAKHLGMYETDDVQAGDHLREISAKWVHAETKWGYELREAMMNRGDALVTNILEPRRVAAMLDMAAELETKAWSCPSASNTTDPWGVPYWVVANTVEGFTGTVGSDHTTKGGLDPDEVPKIKNYAFQYAAISRSDFIRKVRRMWKRIFFKSPIGSKSFNGPTGEDYRHYCGIELALDLEEWAEDQNDNLGSDLLGKFEGSLTMNRNAVIRVPQLDADTTYPFYSINHRTFYPIILDGDNMRQTGPDPAPGMHNVRWVHYDLTYQYFCVNPRGNGVATM